MRCPNTVNNHCQYDRGHILAIATCSNGGGETHLPALVSSACAVRWIPHVTCMPKHVVQGARGHMQNIV